MRFFFLLFLLMTTIGSARASDPAPALADGSMSRAPRHTPVLLIHGIADDCRSMEPMARYLRASGWDAHTLSLRPNWGQAGLEDLAGQIEGFVERTFSKGQRIDLIGFSMGGLACRYYVQRLGGMARVQHFVTLSTPHEGTWIAHLLPNVAGRQMRPGSAFLQDLASDSVRLAQVHITSVWTPLDLVVVPPRNSRVEGARNIRMWVALHPLMVRDARCFRTVAAALRG